MLKRAEVGLDESLMDLADLAVDLGLREDAEYVEARVHKVESREAVLRNGVPDPFETMDSTGLAIRVLVSGSLAFGSTNDLTRESVRDLVGRLVSEAKALRRVSGNTAMSPEDPVVAKWGVEEKERLEDVSLDLVLEEARNMDSIVSSVEVNGLKIANRWIRLGYSIEEKYLVTSEGTRITSRVPRVWVFGLLTASSPGFITQRFFEYGESGGWETIKRMGLEEKVREEAATLLKVAARSESVNLDGVENVIVGPEISGIMAHESVGHPFEADRVLGREAAQAGESYVTIKSVGGKIGSPEASVSDDPTIPNSFGFYMFDEEGVRARKKRLLAEGRINELLHNRESASVFNVSSNGSSRSSNFDREPIIRMSNTFVEPGDYTLDEILEEAGEALLIKSFMEWNIDDKRVNQRYVGLEAYLTKGKELVKMVRNPVLELTTHKLWSSVVARSRDLEFRAATCGKGEPMQGIPVWTGGPYMLLKGVKVSRR